MAVAIPQKPSTKNPKEVPNPEPYIPAPSLPLFKPHPKSQSTAQIARHSMLTYLSEAYAVVLECGIPSPRRTRDWPGIQQDGGTSCFVEVQDRPRRWRKPRDVVCMRLFIVHRGYRSLPLQGCRAAWQHRDGVHMAGMTRMSVVIGCFSHASPSSGLGGESCRDWGDVLPRGGLC